VPAATRESLEQRGRLHAFLQQEVETSEAALAESTKNISAIARLRSIPGVGRISGGGNLERDWGSGAFCFR